MRKRFPQDWGDGRLNAVAVSGKTGSKRGKGLAKEGQGTGAKGMEKAEAKDISEVGSGGVMGREMKSDKKKRGEGRKARERRRMHLG